MPFILIFRGLFSLRQKVARLDFSLNELHDNLNEFHERLNE